MFTVLERKSMAALFCQVRWAGRSNCAKFDEPPCPPPPPPRTDNPCGSGCDKTPPEEYRPNQPIFNRKECCSADCPDLSPRYDDMYYKTSDKAARCYRQTWIECPPPVRVKKTCCFEKLQSAPIEKRKRDSRPKTACPMKDECRLHQPGRCPRIILPGCRSKRNTFHCMIERNPQGPCMNKRCTPYPSYSECTRPKIRKPKAAECDCLAVPEMCMVWAEIEKAIREGRMNKMFK